jgi:hypothetical protein
MRRGGFGNKGAGTQGLANAVERSRIPAPLSNDIFNQHARLEGSDHVHTL